MRRPEIRYPRMDQSAPSSFDAMTTPLKPFGPDYSGLARGNGNPSLSFINARISPASQAAVIANAVTAKAGRLTVVGEVNFVTTSRNAPITITLAKYENIARAIVAIGSRFFEIALMPRWTEKKSTTIKLAKSEPHAPGPRRKAIDPLTQINATTTAGRSAPLHICSSLEALPTLRLDMNLLTLPSWV